MDGENELAAIFTEPIKKSVSSVFDGINSRTEALDLLNKYKNAYFTKLRGLTEKIKILGMQQPIKLVDIYVPTRISTTISRRLYENNWRNIDDKSKVRRSIESYKPTSADHYIDTNDKVIVLAPAGSGKTTFLKYLTLAYIDNEIFKKSNLKYKKFPFFVSLPLFSETSMTVEQYLINEIKSITNEHAEHFVKRKLKKNRSIILMDSLDEVPSALKKEVINRINKFVVNYTDVKVVVSCRVADYVETIDNCHEVEIVRLSDQAIEKIIKAWFKEEPKKATALINCLKTDPDVYSLTETPLLLSLLCIQYSHDLNIPNRKAELYKRCVETLLREWDTTRNFRRDTAFSSLTDDRKERLLEFIAHYFICKNFTYVFHEKELFDIVEECIERFGIARDQSNSVINEIEKHHGIIERYSAETYFFAHPSFQEYFTARSLISKKNELTFVKNNYENIRAGTIITFLAAILEDPQELLAYLMDKSNMTGIKNFPAMARRISNLHLLYKCLSAGIAVSKEFRRKICEHIFNNQLLIYQIYSTGGIYPLAMLEPDGITHTYYYQSIRPTTNDSLQKYRLLVNEILMTPSQSYSNYAVERLKNQDLTKNTFNEVGLLSCLYIPISSSNTDEIKIMLETIIDRIDPKNSSMMFILNKSLSTINKHFTR